MAKDKDKVYSSEELRLKKEDFMEGGVLFQSKIPGLSEVIDRLDKELKKHMSIVV